MNQGEATGIISKLMGNFSPIRSSKTRHTYPSARRSFQKEQSDTIAAAAAATSAAQQQQGASNSNISLNRPTLKTPLEVSRSQGPARRNSDDGEPFARKASPPIKLDGSLDSCDTPVAVQNNKLAVQRPAPLLVVNQQESGYLKFRQYEPNSPVCDTKKQCHNCKNWFWASSPSSRNSFTSNPSDQDSSGSSTVGSDAPANANANANECANRRSHSHSRPNNLANRSPRMAARHEGLQQELERITIEVLPPTATTMAMKTTTATANRGLAVAGAGALNGPGPVDSAPTSSRDGSSRESSFASIDSNTCSESSRGRQSRSSSCGGGTSGSIDIGSSGSGGAGSGGSGAGGGGGGGGAPHRSIFHSIRDSSPRGSGEGSASANWEGGQRIHFCGSECMWSHRMRQSDDERSAQFC